MYTPLWAHHYSQRKLASIKSTRNPEYYKALNLALASHYCVTNAFMSMYNQAVNVRWELCGVFVHSNRFGIISDAGSKIFDGICIKRLKISFDDFVLLR